MAVNIMLPLSAPSHTFITGACQDTKSVLYAMCLLLLVFDSAWKSNWIHCAVCFVNFLPAGTAYFVLAIHTMAVHRDHCQCCSELFLCGEVAEEIFITLP